jgi:propanol-preferring alcohol dehydrogenase
VALGGIHMSPIPPIDYSLLYQERAIRSVANNTRADGEDFLRIAPGRRLAPGIRFESKRLTGR